MKSNQIDETLKITGPLKRAGTQSPQNQKTSHPKMRLEAQINPPAMGVGVGGGVGGDKKTTHPKTRLDAQTNLPERGGGGDIRRRKWL